ncbi:serine/threonine-protein kinase [Telluria beijingensis]|uniref:serine/threonine-protein kinase n=1 Tax=Telluria beijingensis TaxID=3068633 RepID=UPI0027952284|nr:serine/threonine-protein kinase [Massilia sp. REN29]
MNLPPSDDFTILAPGNAPAAPPPGSTPASAPAPDAGHALPVGTRLDEFEITSLLGEGGFGIVYLAYDHLLERQVALKEYMPSFARRGAGVNVSVQSAQNADSFEAGRRSFVNEARLLAKFDHPSLVKVYRFWEDNGTAYMVMPYYRGPTLKQMLLAREAPPDEAWLKRLLAPLLDALESIHLDHCYHRDIAPDNILMVDEGRPVLLDFGAARRAVGEANQAFTVILKQNYAPIEQYAEMPGMSQGPWTDLYALASVVHYAIDGAAPPPAMSRMMSDPYVPLATRHAGKYSAGFLEAIDRALGFKPDARPQSVAELRALLGLDAPTQQLATPIHQPPTPAAPPAAAPAPGAGKRKALIGGGVAAVVLACAGAFLLGEREAAPARTELAGAGVDAGAAAPATTEAAPVEAGPFDPVAALDAVHAGADPSRQVTVKVEHERARIGVDKLGFSITSSHAGYVYVHMVGTNRADFHMLFPNQYDVANRIEAGATLSLPRPSWPIQAMGPAGTDHFVVMVSEAPRDFQAAGLVSGEAMASFPIERAAQAQRAHRGATPLFAGTPACAAAPCPDAYGAATFTIDEVAP